MVISGHTTASEIARNIPRPFRIAVLLREPIERLLSHYYFLSSYEKENIQKYNVALLERICSQNLREVLCDKDCADFFSNYYLKRLDPQYDPREGTRPSLRRAWRFLSECDVVGVTSKMDDFCAEISNLLGAQVDRQDVPFANSRKEISDLPGFMTINRENLELLDIKLAEKIVKKDRFLYDFALSRVA